MKEVHIQNMFEMNTLPAESRFVALTGVASIVACLLSGVYLVEGNDALHYPHRLGNRSADVDTPEDKAVFSVHL